MTETPRLIANEIHFEKTEIDKVLVAYLENRKHLTDEDNRVVLEGLRILTTQACMVYVPASGNTASFDRL